MSRRLYDFTCSNDHTTEHLTDPDQREVLCSVCGHIAKRIISPVSFSLDSSFPGASMKWARDHEKAAKS
jgi:hypothetical protein